MVDALVSFVVKELCALAKDEVGSLVGVKKDVRKLSSTFTAIQAVLEDAERQQLTKKAVRDWLGKLKEVAYEVEDILDEWRLDAFTSHGDEDDIPNRMKVRSCLFFPRLCFKQVELRHDTGHRIREITERLKEISIEKSAFSFNEVNTREVQLGPKMEERQTGSLIDESEIYGRYHDKESIINELVSETSREPKSVSIVSIVGMGGLGKTALAQLVCNDERVKKHFEKTIWVCVSDDFDVQRIATKVIQSMVVGWTAENPDFDTMQRSLHQAVGKRRFLLVLDDVWNENETLWEKLRVPLKGAARGSKILVTTRNRKVAEVMETTHIHDLHILSDSDCWKLFTSRAFKGREEEECIELTEIGKEIVDRCKGVPLALRVVGSLLRCKRMKSDWKFVLESEIWEWKPLEDGGILPALLLSYHSLPPYLKPCFSFCSVFPKDHTIIKDELVKLWTAHGIIQSERVDVEVIGERYFDDLLMHSLFQNAEKNGYGNIVQCQMHDLVHDLAKFVTAGDYCIMKIEDSKLCSVGTYHLSLLVNYDVSSIPSPLCNEERLRTLLLFGRGSIIEAVPGSLFNHLRFLRALDLSGTKIEKLPSSIGKLKHLRYLSLCRSNIMELPEFVTNLNNLLTLRLNKCTRLCMLPIGMSKMVKLRHLEIESTDLTFLPNGLGRLRSLRTLSKFPVGDENGGCKIGELKNLNLLRGKLKLQNLERVMNGNEAMEAELDKKSGLHGLSLECESQRDEDWEMLGDNVKERMESMFGGLRSPGRDKEWGMVGDDEIERMESVFEGLTPPHSDLRKLKILNYVGSKFPTWLEDSKFPSLVKVVLKDCCKCRLLPGLGKLHSLKHLEIHGADEVKVVGGEFYGIGDDRVKGRVFPRLKNLFFDSMPNWEEWKLTEEYGEVMPSLSLLSISNCHKLKALPNCLPNSLRTVFIDNCDQVIWVPDKPLPLLEALFLVGDLSGIFSMKLPFLPALKTLEIKETSNSLSDDGWELLESLHTISIYDCPRLELPDGLGELKALQTLDIYKCSQLTFLPWGLGQLEALHTIRINECNGLMSLLHGPGQFKALRNLEISYCTELWSLSDELVRPEALETIDIYFCSELTSLFGGFEQLTSLRSLKICYCPELTHLPKLQHLISLEELKIMECPLVTALLEKGEDCYDMSHIPCIEIDGRKI